MINEGAISHKDNGLDRTHLCIGANKTGHYVV